MPVLPGPESLGAVPSARSGADIATFDTSAIGRAVAGLGQQMEESAAQLKQSWDRNAAVNAEAGFQKFQTDEAKAYDETANNVPPGQGAGFTQDYLTGYKQRAGAFLKTLPPDLQAPYSARLMSVQARFFHDAARHETGDQGWAATNAVNDGLQNGILPRVAGLAHLPAVDLAKLRGLKQAVDDADLLIGAHQDWTADQQEQARRTARARIIQAAFHPPAPPPPPAQGEPEPVDHLSAGAGPADSMVANSSPEALPGAGAPADADTAGAVPAGATRSIVTPPPQPTGEPALTVTPAVAGGPPQADTTPPAGTLAAMVSAPIPPDDTPQGLQSGAGGPPAGDLVQRPNLGLPVDSNALVQSLRSAGAAGVSASAGDETGDGGPGPETNDRRVQVAQYLSPGTIARDSFMKDVGRWEDAVTPKQHTWGAQDFLLHYTFGRGKPVTLDEIGLKDRWFNMPSVQAEITKYVDKVLSEAKPGYKDKMDHAVFTDVTWKGLDMFPIGHSPVIMSATCDDTKCMFKLSMTDTFSDPFDVREGTNSVKTLFGAKNPQSPGFDPGRPFDISQDYAFSRPWK